MAYCLSFAMPGLSNHFEADVLKQEVGPAMRVAQFLLCIVLLRRRNWFGYWLSVASCCFYGGLGAYSAWVILVSGQVVKLGVYALAAHLSAALILFAAALLLLVSRRAFKAQASCP